jgi:3'(2'), 5'-bisphosphate nucleotidase
MPHSPSHQTHAMIELAIKAGREIMRIYDAGFDAQFKSDHSPVTAADTAAENIILAGLDPAIPVIAEERAAQGLIPAVGDDFYLVDPLDGTREFISRNGEFTVNIALIEQGVPVSGVVYAPALGRVFWGARGEGALAGMVEVSGITWRPIHVRSCPERRAVVVASRSHRDQRTDEFLKNLRDAEVISIGSSLKFCLVASGEADLYPRFGRTMEWDTAAGHAVLLAAGGKVLDEHGAPLIYGKRERGFDNPAFIASA